MLTSTGRAAQLDVIVLCDADDCDDAMSYAVSVAVKQPIVAGMIVYASMQVDSTLEMPFDHAERMAEELALYECTSAAWVARWGRDARERSIRELVASSTGCVSNHDTSLSVSQTHGAKAAILPTLSRSTGTSWESVDLA